MLYLVEGKVETTQYMSDNKEVESKIRLVEAISEKEAEEKYLKYFNDQTDEYSVYYWAWVDEVSEDIS